MRRHSPLPVLLMALLPWPLVWLGLYVLKSAWAAFALYHGSCLICWRLGRYQLPPVSKPVWVHRHWIGLGLVCLLVNLAVYLFAGLFTSLLHPDHLRVALRSIRAGSAWMFVYFAFVNPVVEELFWRGTIYTRLRECRWPVGKCAAVSGVLFGAWHWLPVGLLLMRDVSAVAVAGIMLIGFALAWFYERSRSMGASMLLHGLGTDVPLLIAVYADVVARS